MRTAVLGVGGAAIAVALVWWFRYEPKPEVDADVLAVTPVPLEAAKTIAADAADRATLPREPLVEAAAPVRPQSSPLPGEIPATPMAELIAARQQNVIGREGAAGVFPPPELAAGEREFAAEPIDVAWAPGAEADVLAKFAQMPGLRLIDLKVECRSSMCRLQLMTPAATDGGSGSFNILVDSIGLEPRWMMAVIGTPGGPMQQIAYLWRDGFAPARVDEQPERRN